MAITLRDITDEDDAFLRSVYACSREPELAMVPWTDEQRDAFLRFQFDAQHTYYKDQYPSASFQVILNESVPVGRLYVARRPNDIKILDLTVLPQYRGAGVGSHLMHELLTEAKESGKAVLIWVEQTNPSQKLFKSLGFSKIEDDGYQDLLEWRSSNTGIEIS
jgi:ribosomal protein S18 acetylase RimI-like enzyme